MKIIISKKNWEAMNHNCNAFLVKKSQLQDDRTETTETTEEITEEMVKDENCDPQILTKVIQRNVNDSLSNYAVANPNCPKEVLIDIMRCLKDDLISNIAYENKNCPDIYKKMWHATVKEGKK